MFGEFEGTGSSYSAAGATMLTTLYNEREQPTDLRFYDRAARLLSRVDFSYDQNGNLIEEAQTNTAETLLPEMLTSLNEPQLRAVCALLGATEEPIRRMHRYNEQGRRTESRSGMGPLGGDRKIVAYNDQGDPIEEVFEHEEREYNIDDAGRFSDAPTRESVGRSECRFRYDYDALHRSARTHASLQHRYGCRRHATPPAACRDSAWRPTNES
jgi:hypothetical protein